MMLSIVTVTHRSQRHVPEFVASFLQSGSGRAVDIEFVIVENSGDRDIDAVFTPLRQAGYSVAFLETENRGFGSACNAGAAAARGDILIFANPDVVFVNSIDPLTGIAGSWGTASQVAGGGQPYSFDALLEHKTVKGELQGRYRKLTPIPDRWRDKVFVVGSFLAVDKALFSRVGGFDESFFLYHEEAELGRRLQAAVGAPRYIGEVTVRHDGFGSQSSADSTLHHEMDGFLNYVRVTGRRRPVLVRMAVLALSAPISATARQRLRILAQALLKSDNGRL